MICVTVKRGKLVTLTSAREELHDVITTAGLTNGPGEDSKYELCGPPLTNAFKLRFKGIGEVLRRRKDEFIRRLQPNARTQDRITYQSLTENGAQLDLVIKSDENSAQRKLRQEAITARQCEALRRASIIL